MDEQLPRHVRRHERLVAHLYRDALKPGGVPHQTRRLLEGEAALGAQLLLLAQKGPNDTAASATFLLGRSARDLRRDVGAARASLRRGIDVCHVTGVSIPEHMACFWGLSRAGTPVVVSPHGLLAPLGQDVRWEGQAETRLRKVAKSTYRRLFDRWLIDRATVVHAQSRYEETCVRRIRASAKVVIAPMGVDAEWVRPELRRSSLERPITIGYLGRLDTYHKGLDLLLEAFGSLEREARRDLRVLIAGSPVAQHHGSLERWARSAEVELLPEQWGDAKDEFLSRCDFLYGVYRYAGMARVLGEATGRGIPIIASREGNWGDWVDEFDMGITCELTSGSVAGACESIVGLAEHEYVHMSQRALDFATTWTWHHVAEELLRAYDAAIERQGTSL